LRFEEATLYHICEPHLLSLLLSKAREHVVIPDVAGILPKEYYV